MRRSFLLLVVIIALLLRLSILFFIEGSWGDVDELIARQIAAGNGFQVQSVHGGDMRPTSIKSPGVPFLLALSMRVSENAPRALYTIVAAALGALACWWLARLGERVMGASAGALAAALAAFFVPHIWWLRHVGDHIFGAAAMVLVLLLLYRAERHGDTRSFAAWGLAIGVSAYFSSAVLVPAPLWALWVAWRHRARGARAAITGPIVAGVVALAVIAPWSLRNYLVHESFVLLRTGLGTAMWVGNHPRATGTDWVYVEGDDGDVRPTWAGYAMPAELLETLAPLPEVEQEALLLRVALDWIRDNPGEAARLWVRKLGYYWWFTDMVNIDPVPKIREVAWGGVLLAFAIGLVSRLRAERSVTAPALTPTSSIALQPPWPLLFPLVTSTLLHVTTVVSANWRMRIPVEPIVLLFAAYGLLGLAAAWHRRRDQRR